MSDFPPLGSSAPPPAPGPAPGWWQASDGNWYPPDQLPGGARAYGAAPGNGAAPGYGTPAGSGYGYPPSKGTNGYAIAGLICSIAACGVGSVLAVVFGHMALSQIKKSGEAGRGMAIAGLVLGYLGLAAIVGFIVVVIVAGATTSTNSDFQEVGLVPRMTRISDLVAAGPSYSLEFGPPRTPEQEERLAKTLLELEPLNPSFVSVTYGAGGSTRDATERVVQHIASGTSMTVMPHLTCVAHTRDQLTEIITGYREAGIENLLALGGDPPEDGVEYPSDFAYATELIELARGEGDFSIGVAAFPENHPRSPDTASDRQFLAAKLRLADFGITQFFFDADDYFRMLDELSALGVDTPVLPGIFAFVNVDQARRFAGVNGATIPLELDRRLDLVAGKPPEVRELAVELCTELGERLLAGGAPGLHVYTLNFSRATQEIWSNLGLLR